MRSSFRAQASQDLQRHISSPKPQTILLVDDDRIVRESIATYLEDSGFHVIQSDDGSRGYKSYQEDDPDLVICDLKMPRVDGLSLLRKIADNPKQLPVPLIVISGAGNMSDVVEALRLGASDYIVKPIVDMKVLELSVRNCLERATLQQENQKYREELEESNRQLKESLKILEQDQRAGLQVQLKMFPQEPLKSGDFEVDYKLIPSLYLSGDFLEYSEFREGHIGFYLADVSGHGSSSAFVTALLHHLSVSMVRYNEKKPSITAKPADILSYFNRELLAVGMDKYVTMFLGMIDTRQGKLEYSVAGHLPMPIISTEAGAHYLEGSGMPLGIVPGVEYYNYEIDIPDDFTLCLFSDGVLEVLPVDGLLKQEDCLLKMIRQGHQTIPTISSFLNLESLQEVPDDIAIMTIKKSKKK